MKPRDIYSVTNSPWVLFAPKWLTSFRIRYTQPPLIPLGAYVPVLIDDIDYGIKLVIRSNTSINSVANAQFGTRWTYNDGVLHVNSTKSSIDSRHVRSRYVGAREFDTTQIETPPEIVLNPKLGVDKKQPEPLSQPQTAPKLGGEQPLPQQQAQPLSQPQTAPKLEGVQPLSTNRTVYRDLMYRPTPDDLPRLSAVHGQTMAWGFPKLISVSPLDLLTEITMKTGETPGKTPGKTLSHEKATRAVDAGESKKPGEQQQQRLVDTTPRRSKTDTMTPAATDVQTRHTAVGAARTTDSFVGSRGVSDFVMQKEKADISDAKSRSKATASSVAMMMHYIEGIDRKIRTLVYSHLGPDALNEIIAVYRSNSTRLSLYSKTATELVINYGINSTRKASRDDVHSAFLRAVRGCIGKRGLLEFVTTARSMPDVVTDDGVTDLLECAKRMIDGIDSRAKSSIHAMRTPIMRNATIRRPVFASPNASKFMALAETYAKRQGNAITSDPRRKILMFVFSNDAMSKVKKSGHSFDKLLETSRREPVPELHLMKFSLAVIDEKYANAGGSEYGVVGTLADSHSDALDPILLKSVLPTGANFSLKWVNEIDATKLKVKLVQRGKEYTAIADVRSVTTWDAHPNVTVLILETPFDM